jgi:hypothetical protein
MSDHSGAVASTVNVFKQQPLIFALVVMNLALLGLLYYLGAAASNERGEQAKLLYQNHSDMAELLTKCRVERP